MRQHSYVLVKNNFKNTAFLDNVDLNELSSNILREDYAAREEDDEIDESAPLMEQQNFQNRLFADSSNPQKLVPLGGNFGANSTQKSAQSLNFTGDLTPSASSNRSLIFNESDEDRSTVGSETTNQQPGGSPVKLKRAKKFRLKFDYFSSCFNCIRQMCRPADQEARILHLGALSTPPHKKFPPNAVNNQKYNILTFVPLVLFNQFKFFLNLYFLIMALSQFIPDVRVGYLSTYWGPLGFVLGVTMIREAVDDFRRFMRDREVNVKKYEKVTAYGRKCIKSSRIEVGDLIVVHKDERVPADMVLLRTTEKLGSCFIRTDQLDGETDWKLRIAAPFTQHLTDESNLFAIDITIYAEKPMKDIHSFIGTIRHVDENGTIHEDALNVENTLWANTVVASGATVGMVIYTGCETRSAMNASKAHSKVGLIDYEINNLTKVLFIVTLTLAFTMVCLKGLSGPWYLYLFRFLLLFSYIIPLSLLVNLDMARLVYSSFISRDKDIPGTVVRSSTIPEELGRISYLLSDKTGTLTQNKMIFKKLHLGSVAFNADTHEDVKAHLISAFNFAEQQSASPAARQSMIAKVKEAVQALALCHNVTPVYDTETECVNLDGTEADLQQKQAVSFQASSPDEVALVTWVDRIGLKLVQRDLQSMQLKSPKGEIITYKILQIFPFTSENKRMGIIVQQEGTNEITFYVKGADSVMVEKVQYNDWVEEESANLAREGLRTLVVAKKVLTDEQYAEFEREYSQAKLSLQDRAGRTLAVLSVLESNMQALCITGVEDSLQVDVPVTLELLKNAGIKIWMLTGDKLETAVCISKSSGLIGKTQPIYVFSPVLNRTEARNQLNNLSRKRNHSLVITGQSLKICLEEHEEEFAELASNCPAVVCCRCSPEQKAQIVALIKKYHRPARVAAVGDGGNDVSMIQAADAGIGIVGKEGRQASLAADFSITQFSHLSRLLLVHGRYCYKRSCALSQFVMHRGLIISTMQAIFSCVFYFASVSLYQGMLMVAYSTIYTNFPVFSLVMDQDAKPADLLIFPELYKELTKGRSLSYKTFGLWFLASVYQGAIIMYLALLLFDADFIHIVSITFTALIFNELIMVALTIHTWHWIMLVAELFSVGIYALSLFVLKGFFDVNFVQSASFWWKTAVITAVACVPLYLAKYLRRRIAPPAYARIN